MLVFILFFVGLLIIQFQTPDIAGNDGYYHVKLAEALWEQKLAFTFDWLPLTILDTVSFVDHHFLFHLLLMPFLAFGLLSGAKIAAAFFAAAAFTACYALLRTQQVNKAFLWSFALFSVSHAFMYRMQMPRAQSLSLAILLTAVNVLLQGRYRWMAPLSFAYVWLFNGYPLILTVGLLYALSMLLVEKRVIYQPLLYSALGLIAGIVVNPFFPNNVQFSIQHILPKVFNPIAVEVGDEWYPYTTGQLIENSGLALLLLTAGVIAWALTQRQERQEAKLFAFGLVILTGFMLFRSRRFIEYFPAFALVFSALTLDAPLKAFLSSDASEKLKSAMRILLLSGLAATALTSSIRGVQALQASKPAALYQGASTWLVENTPADAVVFHSDWDDFPRLFFYNDHNRYITGLDPTYLSLADREKADLWEAITAGRVHEPAYGISAVFGAQYALVGTEQDAMIQRCFEDPGLALVYQDDDALIFVVINVSE
jgi:hypothetical protein